MRSSTNGIASTITVSTDFANPNPNPCVLLYVLLTPGLMRYAVTLYLVPLPVKIIG